MESLATAHGAAQGHNQLSYGPGASWLSANDRPLLGGPHMLQLVRQVEVAPGRVRRVVAHQFCRRNQVAAIQDRARPVGVPCRIQATICGDAGEAPDLGPLLVEGPSSPWLAAAVQEHVFARWLLVPPDPLAEVVQLPGH